MKLAKTIRFDPSDLNVFPLAADEGEWALVGTFCFTGIGEADIKDPTVSPTFSLIISDTLLANNLAAIRLG